MRGRRRNGRLVARRWDETSARADHRVPDAIEDDNDSPGCKTNRVDLDPLTRSLILCPREVARAGSQLRAATAKNAVRQKQSVHKRPHEDGWSCEYARFEEGFLHIGHVTLSNHGERRDMVGQAHRWHDHLSNHARQKGRDVDTLRYRMASRKTVHGAAGCQAGGSTSTVCRRDRLPGKKSE